MAIRYSGDVEVRIQYGGAGYLKNNDVPYFDPSGEGFYYAHIRAPHMRDAAILSTREVGLTRKSRFGPKLDPRSSEAYDAAALAFLKWAELHVGELPVELDKKGIVVRRVFQSPCPIRT